MLRKEAHSDRERISDRAFFFPLLGIILAVLFWVFDAAAIQDAAKEFSAKLLYPGTERLLLRAGVAGALIFLGALAGTLNKRYIALKQVEYRTGVAAAKLRRSARTSQINLRKLLEGIPGGVINTTADGTVLRANNLIAEMLGSSSPDEVRDSVFKYLHAERSDRQEIEAALQNGKDMYAVPVSLVLAGGEHERAVASIIKLIGEDGLVSEYVWLVQRRPDDRKEDPAAQRDASGEDTWADIRSQEIVIALDETGVMLNVSSSAVDLTGYSLEDQAACETPLDVVHPRDWPRVAAAINRAFAKPGATQSVLFRYRHKGGYWAEFFGAGNVQEDRMGRRLLWATLCDPSQAPAPSVDEDSESVSGTAPREKRDDHGVEFTAADEPRAPEPSQGPATILVVEDEAAMREMVVRFLDELGYRVLDAADGPEALKLLDAHPEVDLLFSDVMLPNGMNGPAVAERARRIRPDLKVLYTSIYTEHYFAYSGGLNRDATLLTKPYDKRTLAKHIREALPAGARAVPDDWDQAV